MTDVDRIYEAALADEWEEQNKSESDRFPDWDNAAHGQDPVLECIKCSLRSDVRDQASEGRKIA